MRFQYDPAKDATNVRKHGVWFADAEGVFEDPLALLMEDPDALGERRYIAIGLRHLGRAACGCLLGACRKVPLDLGAPRHAKGTQSV